MEGQTSPSHLHVAPYPCPGSSICSPSLSCSQENPLFHRALGHDPGYTHPSTSNPFPPPQWSLPDNVVVVSQEEFLAVLSGVVHHPYPSYKVDHLLAGGVVQVVAALVTPVPVHPLQPELASGSCPIRHDSRLRATPGCPARRLCPLQGSSCDGPARAQGKAPGANFRGDAQTRLSTPAATIICCCGREAADVGTQQQDPAGLRDSFPRGQAGFGGASTRAHASLHLRALGGGRGSPRGHPAFKIRDLHIQTRITSSPSLRSAGGFAAGGGIYSVTGLI